MNIEDIIKMVNDGSRCFVNFKDKTVKLNRKIVAFDDITSEDFVDEIRSAYRMYKYSTPNKRTLSARRNYFVALDFDDLSTADLVVGEDRSVAKARLELCVLSSYKNGNLEKLFTDDHWFWQDDIEKSLVILKDWF